MKKILIASALALVSGPSAFAGFVNTTCAEAQDTYARNGRIYVNTYSGDIVPIYGLSPRCRIGEQKNAYWVRATDKRTCVIGYTCSYDGGENRDRGNRGRDGRNNGGHHGGHHGGGGYGGGNHGGGGGYGGGRR